MSHLLKARQLAAVFLIFLLLYLAGQMIEDWVVEAFRPSIVTQLDEVTSDVQEMTADLEGSLTAIQEEAEELQASSGQFQRATTRMNVLSDRIDALSDRLSGDPEPQPVIQPPRPTLFRRAPLTPVGFDARSYRDWLLTAVKKIDTARAKPTVVEYRYPHRYRPEEARSRPANASLECCRPNFDPESVYSIQDRPAFWSLTTVGRATSGLKDVNEVKMKLGSYDNCPGSGSHNECGYRLIALGDDLYNIETADRKGILGIKGKNANNRVLEQNPVLIYRKSHYKLENYGKSDETVFKILPNGNGLWRILAGDESGTLIFWDHHTHLGNYLRGRRPDNLPVYVVPYSYENVLAYDGQFRLTRIS
jgi:hypothetical protein